MSVISVKRRKKTRTVTLGSEGKAGEHLSIKPEADMVKGRPALE